MPPSNCGFSPLVHEALTASHQDLRVLALAAVMEDLSHGRIQAVGLAWPPVWPWHDHTLDRGETIEGRAALDVLRRLAATWGEDAPMWSDAWRLVVERRKAGSAPRYA